MRAQLDSLVGREFAQPFAAQSQPPVHQGPHPHSAYAPGLVPVPRAPPTTGYQGPPLGSTASALASSGPPGSPNPTGSQHSLRAFATPSADQAGSEGDTEEAQELATALYDYKPTAEDELPFAKGDTIVIKEHTTEDWFTGHVEGRLGPDRLFPSNYVEVHPPQTASVRQGGPPASSSSASQRYGGSVPTQQQQQGYASQGYGAYAPQGYGSYPPAQPGQYESAPTEEKNQKWDKFKKSNVGQAAAGGAAFGAFTFRDPCSLSLFYMVSLFVICFLDACERPALRHMAS